ncbi:MAG: nuclear transport factor 2 family protein [Bacteroidota bacterium]
MKIALYLCSLLFGYTASFGQVPQTDLKKEYQKIEATRTLFTESLKGKDYAKLLDCIAKDFISINPGTEPFIALNEIFKERGGIPYDSIFMYPKETVIVSDSVAYDFGTRKSYYTDNQGKPVELQDTYLTLLKKGKDQRWKVYREVASGFLED